MYSGRRTAALPAVGFPIRTSPDQSLVSGSPTLFAATHVLLRLLSPRHPSCALSSLVFFLLLASLPTSPSRRPRSSAVVSHQHWGHDPSCGRHHVPVHCAHAVVKELPVGAYRVRTDD